MSVAALDMELPVRGLDGFSIDLAETGLPDDARDEPVWTGAAPFLVEFDEVLPLDPGRAAAEDEDDGPALPSDTAGRAVRPFGPTGSAMAHMFVAAILVLWNAAPLNVPQPIPVQLVLETPPPPPPDMVASDKAPPPGRLASEDMGAVKPPEPGNSAPAAENQAPTAQSDAKPAAAPKPIPPEPKPPDRLAAVKPAPQLVPPPAPAHKPAPTPPAAPSRPKEIFQHQAAKVGKLLGPSATRDEYLAYILELTKQHMGLLPVSYVAGRQGETVLAIRVLDDGTIARIGIAHSSGYPDIDERVEQMVHAVGRFPPLPQWIQAPAIELHLQLRFPDALEQR